MLKRSHIKSLLFFACLVPVSALASKGLNTTAVVTEKGADTATFPWGSLATYYSGATHGTKDALGAVATIKPGMQIHPPHSHSEEEYLLVLEGSGTWTLDDKDFPARAGDMLYAAPWDLHGIKNTGRTNMKFVVFKWNGKGVALKKKP